MKYTIIIEKRAMKFITSQPKTRQVQLLSAIQKLPDVGDIAPLQGRTKSYRLRVGDYRIVFTRDDMVLKVTVVNAGNRGDVYKN